MLALLALDDFDVMIEAKKCKLLLTGMKNILDSPL
jgi:hypothetical protein